MVPVGALERESVFAELRARLAKSGRRHLSSAFATWLLPDAEDPGTLASLAGRVTARAPADYDFPSVASLGFAADAGVLSHAQTEALRTGLCRLAGRSQLVGGLRMAFPMDAVGILGVALGARMIDHNDVTTAVTRWVTTFLKDSYTAERVEHWQRVLFTFADLILGAPLHLALPIAPDAADVRTAMRARCLLDPGTRTLAKEDALRTTSLTTQDMPEDWECDRIALRLAAIDYVSRPEVFRLLAQGEVAKEHGRRAVVGGLNADVAARAARRQTVVNPILKEKRWKPGRLATEAGVGKNSVYQYLDGTRVTITQENRDAIVDALGIPSDELPD